MTKILLATFNPNKREELKTLLESFNGIEVMSLEDMKVRPPMIVEDGKTFRQNAVKKAVVMSRFFDGLVLADDSGLEVDALEGKPGVRSARFARKKATDEENNTKLLSLLKKTVESQRNARFVCHIAIAQNGDLIDSFESTVEGKIAFEPSGISGFGYDPLFIPDGHKETFAEMKADEKNEISHRGKALKKLKKAIGKYL
jgi:XTP/dITP diphosphohydrolase